MSLVSFANYKWFEEWKDGKVTNRGTDYKELKQAFIDSILEVVMDIFPKITRDKVNFLSLSALVLTIHKGPTEQNFMCCSNCRKPSATKCKTTTGMPFQTILNE